MLILHIESIYVYMYLRMYVCTCVFVSAGKIRKAESSLIMQYKNDKVVSQ